MKRRKSLKLLTILSLTAAYFSLFAQQQSSAVIASFDRRFEELDSLIFASPSSNTQTLSILSTDLSGNIIADSLYAEAINNLTRERIGTINSQTGIQLTGQTYYRFDDELGFDDEDALSRYKAKAQIEARWYFMQSSLFKHEGRLREARLEGEIEIISHEKDRLDRTIYSQKELLRQASDSILAGVLAHRVKNLQMLQDANLYLLRNEDISSDEMLRIIDSRAQAERKLATLYGEQPCAESLRGADACIIQVDTSALLGYISESLIDMHLMELRGQLLDTQAQNESWWSSARIAPFVRYSYYYRTVLPASTNVDAGISFTIPIDGESAHKRSEIKAQKKVLEAKKADARTQSADKIRYLATEIDRLNRASEGECLRIKELKKYLMMRNEAYINRKGEYSRLARLKEYNNYIESIEKLIEFQYSRDCLIADLQAFLIDKSILDFCTVHILDN